MAYDSPSLGGHVFENPPKPIEVYVEAIQHLHELADGGHRQRILGYRTSFTLKWEDGWIKKQDIDGLLGIIASGTASYAFKPRPQSNPTLSYTVIWKNQFEFSYHNGHFGTYGGTIELITPNTTSTFTEMP